MPFSRLSIFFWFAGGAIDLILIVVLALRHRWRQFPVFTCLIAFTVLRTVSLMLIYYWVGRGRLYTTVYLGAMVADFALQVAVVLEIARIILRPTGTWVHDAKIRFIGWGLAGVVVAALLVWLINPASKSALLLWQVRSNLFTSLVICELFTVMTLTANRLGLGWRSHVMAIGQGLTVWSTVMVVKTALESFLGTGTHYAELEQIRSVTYLGAICWMTLQLWRDEPERRPISADLHQYILALHRRVEYDLRRLDVEH
jgi:hypothetical protein